MLSRSGSTGIGYIKEKGIDLKVADDVLSVAIGQIDTHLLFIYPTTEVFSGNTKYVNFHKFTAGGMNEPTGPHLQTSG